MAHEGDDTRSGSPPDPLAASGDATVPATPPPEAPGPEAPVPPAPVSLGPPRLVLIGTGHVFKIEDTIRSAIHALRPDVVFVELDRGRLNALMYRRQHGRMPPGNKGFVQSRLAAFQEAVAGSYDAEVGGEMLAAVEGAGDVRARVGLIDVPAQVTVKTALKQLTWKEKGRAVGQLVSAGFKRLVPGKSGVSVEDEIGKYQNDPSAALDELKRQFPTVYRVVIDDRDEHMARRIRMALAGGGFGVAVVGDGHVDGMLRRLQQVPDLEITTYRLPEVRNGLLPKPEAAVAHGDPTDVSYGFNVDL